MTELTDKAVHVCYRDIHVAFSSLTSQKTQVNSDKTSQQHFEHIRETKLRQWFQQAHSKDRQTKIAAQVRLDTQYRLRARRSQIAVESVSSAAIRTAIANGLRPAWVEEARRKKVETINQVVAGLVREAIGERPMDEKKTTYRARFWVKRGKSLEQVLADSEWDRRIEFGVDESEEDGDENRASPEGTGEMVRDGLSEDDEESGVHKRGEKRNGILVSREEIGSKGEDIVSDDDEEGGVLLPMEMRKTFDV
jgi:post-segregation antitoxin (ccd killing protein)